MVGNTRLPGNVEGIYNLMTACLRTPIDAATTSVKYISCIRDYVIM